MKLPRLEYDIKRFNFSTKIQDFRFDIEYLYQKEMPYAKMLITEEIYECNLQPIFINIVANGILKFDYSFEYLMYFLDSYKEDYLNPKLNFDFYFDLSGYNCEITKREDCFFLIILDSKQSFSTQIVMADLYNIMKLVNQYNANLCSILIEYGLQNYYDHKTGIQNFPVYVNDLQKDGFKLSVIGEKTKRVLQQIDEFIEDYEAAAEQSVREMYLRRLFPEVNSKN